MAQCPACDRDVRTPFFLDLDGWTHLACDHCKARLELKPPHYFVFGILIGPLFVLARRGAVYEGIAFGFLLAMLGMMLVECARPKLRLRTRPLPKPSIRLNIDGTSN